jgi:BRCA1-associated protein
MRGYHVRIVLHLPPSKSQKTDAFIPLSLWQPLPTHPRKSTLRRNATFNPRRKDYRLGPIALDWADIDNMAATPFTDRGRADPKGEFIGNSQVEGLKLSPARASGTAVATFVPQNRTKSGSTNLPDGVVHVYRDAERQKLAETDEGISAPDASRMMLENADSDGYMVGVLAVPSWMTPSDFLAFVAPAQEDMSHLRMVRWVSCWLQHRVYSQTCALQGYCPQSIHSSHQVSQARECLGVCRSVQWEDVQFHECQYLLLDHLRTLNTSLYC